MTFQAEELENKALHVPESSVQTLPGAMLHPSVRYSSSPQLSTRSPLYLGKSRGSAGGVSSQAIKSWISLLRISGVFTLAFCLERQGQKWRVL